PSTRRTSTGWKPNCGSGAWTSGSQPPTDPAPGPTARKRQVSWLRPAPPSAAGAAAERRIRPPPGPLRCPRRRGPPPEAREAPQGRTPAREADIEKGVTTALPDPALVVLIGASGSGKSAWAAARYRPEEVVSSDELRGIVGSGEHDLDASADA